MWNRAQRRAITTRSPHCQWPGCEIPATWCDIHHVIWWEHGGLSDLDNFLPVCEQHHQKIHHDHWQLTLTPDRLLTIRFPDGSIMTTGPPTRHAA